MSTHILRGKTNEQRNQVKVSDSEGDINVAGLFVEWALEQGYNDIFLKQSLHSMLAMPFFLLTMTALASILVLGTLKKSKNTRFIIIGQKEYVLRVQF